MRGEIRTDQIECMGCLSACGFSNWAQNEKGSTGKKPDPRSYCIQKTLQAISHGGQVEDQLMFAGHNAFKFKDDPFYANGFVPTVRELVERLTDRRLMVPCARLRLLVVPERAQIPCFFYFNCASDRPI